jgi:antirestriction protein ArdC
MTRTTTKTKSVGRSSSTGRAKGAAERDEKIAALHAQIAEGVEGLVTAGAWQAMLDAAAKFHAYSFGNQMLIALQSPTATRVAGFRTWQALGRQVRKGEKGIGILAPCTYRPKTEAPDDGKTTQTPTTPATDSPTPPRPQLRGFRAVYVFDQAQTEGEDLPTLGETPATGTVPAGLWDGLTAQITAHGYTVQRGDCGTAEGYTDPATKTVRVTGTAQDAEAVCTLAHELAHIECGHVQDLPTYTTCRGSCEVEAESVAYIISAAHGVTSTSTFGYVTGWAHGEVSAVRATADTVTAAARTILNHLDDHSPAALAGIITGETDQEIPAKQ